MTPEQNDEARVAILSHYFFGSTAKPPTGSQLVYRDGINILSPDLRQRLMERVLRMHDFESADHDSESFDFMGRQASFQLLDGKRLVVGLE
jgi:hypothetical protein